MSLLSGRLVAVEPAAPPLEPGPLDAMLVVAGVPVGDLATGTRLRVGETVVLELGGPPGAGGLREAPGGAAVPARVLAGGGVRVGDAVALEAVPVPLEDALDLHSFPPAEIADVVAEYLTRAHAAGLDEVRLIHGRGRGVQRDAVRRVLAASPLVAAFGDARPERGGWGATVVRLRPG